MERFEDSPASTAVVEPELATATEEIALETEANIENEAVASVIDEMVDAVENKENSPTPAHSLVGSDELKEDTENNANVDAQPAPFVDVLTDISNNLGQLTIPEKEDEVEEVEQGKQDTAEQIVNDDKKDSGSGDEAMRLVLSQFKALALQTENHPVLMKDAGSLMMLVLSLGSTSSEVVFEGLAIVHLLSQKVENRRSLYNTLHMMDALEKIVEDKLHSGEIVSFAALIQDMLKRSHIDKIPQTKQEKIKGKCKTAKAKAQDVNRKMNRSMSKSKPVYLYIPYNIFFKEKRNTITETLSQDKDVLSITFDMNKCLCLLRIKNHALPETFGKAVANLGIECYLVALNDKNEEIKIQMMGDSKLDKDVYEYLPESDEENNKSLDEKVLATAEDVKRKNDRQKKGWFASAKSLFW